MKILFVGAGEEVGAGDTVGEAVGAKEVVGEAVGRLVAVTGGTKVVDGRETGASVGNISPLGLLLTPGKGGAPGVESRWSFRGKHVADRTGTWRLARLRARTAPEAVWQVQDEGEGMTLLQTDEAEG